MFACLKHLWTSSWVATETETTEWREKAQLVTWMSIGRKKNRDCAVWNGWHFMKHYWMCEKNVPDWYFIHVLCITHQLCFICNFISCYMTSAVLKKKSYATKRRLISLSTPLRYSFAPGFILKHHVIFDLYC